MNKLILSLIATCTCFSSIADARGARPNELGATEQPIGAAGVMWYTTWESGLAEAKRSGRPILYYAAAAQCSEISGTF